MTRRVELCALVLVALARPGRAQWSAMPPECEGRCWEVDNEHPLARCPPDVLDDAVTAAQADTLIREAEAFAGVHGWTTKRHAAYPTTDLPWYVLSPHAKTIIEDVWRVMASNVKSRCGLASDARLTINDVFVVKYTPEGQPGLHRHRDGSFASFNLMLSDPEDYEGGGTRMWDAANVDRHKAEYWAAEAEARTRTTQEDAVSDDDADASSVASFPAGGWHAYDPKPSVLDPAHATVYRLNKGQMLTAGGFNVHEGLPVTRGTRYIVAGFVGLNRHCCAFKYAGWRGVLGLVRVYMMKKMDPAYGGDNIPAHDWRLYEEGLVALRTALVYICAAGTVFALAVAKIARSGGPMAMLRERRRRRKRLGLLPSKSYD